MAHGIKRVVVISQGFADADDRGKELQAELVALAREHGVRFLGPNTMGVLNPFCGFTTAFIDVPREPAPAPLTMVAQSGAFQVGASSFTGRMGKAIDVGNAGDVDVVDVLEYLEHDPETRIIVLHLEGIKRGRRFLNTAARVARTKPIIALKTGRSAAGARPPCPTPAPWWGKMPLSIWPWPQAGIIRVRTLVELLAVSRAFLNFRPMAGPRLGVVTATGAFGIIAADACDDYGLELAPFPEGLRELEEERIAWHQLHNPVDLWPLGMVTGSFTGVFQRAVAGLFADDQVDAVLGVGPAFASPRHADLDIPAAVRELHEANPGHKPLALLLYGDEAAHRAQVAGNWPVNPMWPVSTPWKRPSWAWRPPGVTGNSSRPRRPEISACPSRGRRPVTVPPEGVLVGEAALKILQAYDLPLVPGVLTADVAAAAAAAAEMGYPVVLKIISPEWLHKSDWGGVRLNVTTEAELRQAYQDLDGAVSGAHPRRAPWTASWCRSRCKGSNCSWG